MTTGNGACPGFGSNTTISRGALLKYDTRLKTWTNISPENWIDDPDDPDHPGQTLWDELVLHYARGVDEVGAMNATWARMKPHVDPERFQITADFLHIQEQDAQIWRDASIAYFQSLSALPLPAGIAPPLHTLDYYKALSLPLAPGSPGKTAAPFRSD